ncbi:MAG TPA: hypothetical protein VJL81_14520 [Solirubrobacterales bacterium]|nr:hypothetical protein [Solirubrobacterales bacterium]
MDAGTAALIGAFGGAIIGFLGAIKVAADQRVEARRIEKRHALAVYLGALTPVVGELKEMPPNKEPNFLTKAIDQASGEQATWVRTRKGLVAMSPHIFGRMDRLSSAMAQVQLLEIHPGVMDAVEAANDYAAKLGEERSEELIQRWPSIHAELLEVLQASRYGAQEMVAATPRPALTILINAVRPARTGRPSKSGQRWAVRRSSGSTDPSHRSTQRRRPTGRDTNDQRHDDCLGDTIPATAVLVDYCSRRRSRGFPVARQASPASRQRSIRLDIPLLSRA